MSASLFLMGVILLWQFNSFYGVFVTLSAVLLSTVGVLLGIQVNLFHTFDYVSIIMAGTGVVALAGRGGWATTSCWSTPSIGSSATAIPRTRRPCARRCSGSGR